MKDKIFLADLTHTGNGFSALTFPLGTAFVASYAQKMLGDQYTFDLFKFPNDLTRSIVASPPVVLGFANYSWNLELSYKIASWAKSQYPDITVVFGGPNFPVSVQEKQQFLANRPAVDFYIENEGEVGFVKLLKDLLENDHQAQRLKNSGADIANCTYLIKDQLISGQIERIMDVNVIPSPYLSGLQDSFFDLPLVPMMETTRGCPFSCSFCADGMERKNKIVKFDSDRTRDELHYIAERVRNVDELIITDLNFGMYQADVDTAHEIAVIQAKYQWPVIVGASAGKNKPQRIIETASILKGSWVVGSAIQSTDDEVLKNIKRTNISKDAYSEFNQYMRDLNEDAMTYSEIILGLPGDTKKKHFESLRYGIENQVNCLRMFQAILLPGTDMATPETRTKYELATKFRIIPGSVGNYEHGDTSSRVAEIEEIIVGGKDLPFADYISCRIMNLFVETFHNNALCDEIFAALRVMEISEFDVLVYFLEHSDMYSPKMKEVIASFIAATTDDLYSSHEQAEELALSDELFSKYLSGELGANELLDHRADLYINFDDTLNVLVKAVKAYLDDAGLSTDAVIQYLDETMEFVLLKKNEVYKPDLEMEHTFKYDFKAIQDGRFTVDPRTVKFADQPVRLKFFNRPEQKKHIENTIQLYSNHPGGIGRTIQRSNLNKMFREVERV